MFASGIKEIYKKIEAIDNPTKKQDAFVYLESQITKNPFLKHQFESLNFIKGNIKKIVIAINVIFFNDNLG